MCWNKLQTVEGIKITEGTFFSKSMSIFSARFQQAEDKQQNKETASSATERK